MSVGRSPSPATRSYMTLVQVLNVHKFQAPLLYNRSSDSRQLINVTGHWVCKPGEFVQIYGSLNAPPWKTSRRAPKMGSRSVWNAASSCIDSTNPFSALLSFAQIQSVQHEHPCLLEAGRGKGWLLGGKALSGLPPLHKGDLHEDTHKGTSSLNDKCQQQ